MAHVQKYLWPAREVRRYRVCADENSGVLDWKVLRRELVIARIKAGLEEDQLATAMGVAVSTIYRTEKSGSGKHNPSLENVAKWVQACGLTLTQFMAIIEAHTTPTTDAQRGTGKSAVLLAKVALRDTETPQDSAESQETAARVVSAAQPSHGQTRDVSQDLEGIRREMRQATAALLLALDYTDALAGKAVAEPGRQAAKARAAVARKRQRARKNRRKGAGTT